MARRRIAPVWLGRVGYREAHALQQDLVARRTEGAVGDTVLLLEHPPVLTLGRSAKDDHVLAPASWRTEHGVEVIETERGGDVTYHGPGQLVAYPVLSLSPDRQDVRRYVKDLVRVMSLLCADVGIGAGGRDDLIGAWVDLDHLATWPGAEFASRPAKIGAIGVKISRWVTMHGFALNAHPDLSHFAWIVPCGISQYPVTSLEALGVSPVPTVESLARRAVDHFAAVFDADIDPLTTQPP